MGIKHIIRMEAIAYALCCADLGLNGNLRNLSLVGIDIFWGICRWAFINSSVLQ